MSSLGLALISYSASTRELSFPLCYMDTGMWFYLYTSDFFLLILFYLWLSLSFLPLIPCCHVNNPVCLLSQFSPCSCIYNQAHIHTYMFTVWYHLTLFSFSLTKIPRGVLLSGQPPQTRLVHDIVNSFIFLCHGYFVPGPALGIVDTEMNWIQILISGSYSVCAWRGERGLLEGQAGAPLTAWSGRPC